MPSLKEQEKKRVIERAKKELSEINRAIYKDDFTKLSEELVSAIKRIDQRLATDLQQVKGITKKERDELKATFTETTNALKEDLQERFNTLSEEHRKGMNYVYDKVNSLQDGLDGEDADEERVKDMVLAEIKEFDPTELHTSLQEIVSEHQAMKKKLEELEKRPRGGGGGTSAMGVRQAMKYIVQTETPTGDIDGANTTYTVKHNIFAVIGFSLNGEVIAETPNYSYSGRTITFTSALPAAYSGKDFQIIYFG